MKNNSENTNAFIIHASAFLSFIIPITGIIAPLIAWKTVKLRSDFLDNHGKEAVNFNISYTLYIGILSFFTSDTLWNFNLFTELNFIKTVSIVYIIKLIRYILIIIAALRAKEGNIYQYPLTIKFLH